jgi:hypothetical protein
MKKILILLTLFLACIMMRAQQIDTTLLYGRWQLYSSTSAHGAMYRDSFDQNLKFMMPQAKAMNVKKGFTYVDSLGMISAIKDLFETYFAFAKGGQVTAQVGVDKDPIKGEPLVETGTYEWIGENKMVIHLRSQSMTIMVLGLTAAKLVIKAWRKGYHRVHQDPVTTFTRTK